MNTAHKQRHAIAPRQIKAIHAALHKIGLDDDAYRAMLNERYRVKSCKNLTWRQAEELLDFLNGKSSNRPPVPGPRSLKYTDLDGRPGMCSGKQARMIEAMWAEVSRATTAEDREHALWVFLRRITGVDHFRFLKGWQVEKVVKALETMRDQGPGTRDPKKPLPTTGPRS